MNNIIPTTIRIEEEKKKAIEDIAKVEQRSFNKMVEYILQKFIYEYMQEQEKKASQED